MTVPINENDSKKVTTKENLAPGIKNVARILPGKIIFVKPIHLKNSQNCIKQPKISFALSPNFPN